MKSIKNYLEKHIGKEVEIIYRGGRVRGKLKEVGDEIIILENTTEVYKDTFKKADEEILLLKTIHSVKLNPKKEFGLEAEEDFETEIEEIES